MIYGCRDSSANNHRYTDRRTDDRQVEGNRYRRILIHAPAAHSISVKLSAPKSKIQLWGINPF